MSAVSGCLSAQGERKLRFPSESAARHHRAFLHQMSRRKRTDRHIEDLKAYRCGDCSQWHLGTGWR